MRLLEAASGSAQHGSAQVRRGRALRRIAVEGECKQDSGADVRNLQCTTINRRSKINIFKAHVSSFQIL